MFDRVLKFVSLLITKFLLHENDEVCFSNDNGTRFKFYLFTAKLQ